MSSSYSFMERNSIAIIIIDLSHSPRFSMLLNFSHGTLISHTEWSAQCHFKPNTSNVKGLVHPKIKIQSLITHYSKLITRSKPVRPPFIFRTQIKIFNEIREFSDSPQTATQLNVPIPRNVVRTSVK